MWVFASADAWAVPLNTALLVVLAAVTAYTAKGQRVVKKRDIVDIKKKLGMTRRSYDPGPHEDIPDTGERRRLTDPGPEEDHPIDPEIKERP